MPGAPGARLPLKDGCTGWYGVVLVCDRPGDVVGTGMRGLRLQAGAEAVSEGGVQLRRDYTLLTKRGLFALNCSPIACS